MDHAKSVWNLSAKLPSAVCRDVEKALTWLHAKDIVFGDLRGPNILYDRSEDCAILIDFDWAGKKHDRYSASLDVFIDWPEGVYP